MPGLFDTAKEAAIIRASIMKGMKESNDGRLFVPPKQDRQQCTSHALSRSSPQRQQQQRRRQHHCSSHWPLRTTVAVPLSTPMWQLPFAAVSPLPMPQIGYFPPICILYLYEYMWALEIIVYRSLVQPMYRSLVQPQ